MFVRLKTQSPILPLFLFQILLWNYCGIINAKEKFEFIPVEILGPISNPNCGITFPNYREGQEIGSLKKEWVDIAYKKYTWDELEPSEGQYNFTKIIYWIDSWKKKGFRVAFGVRSTTFQRVKGNIVPLQATPLWVFESGVPGVWHFEKGQIDPVYWDKEYLKKNANFIRALGKALDGGKGIEFIDMRSIGVYGEMHFAFWEKGMWTEQELRANGFTEERLEEAYKTMIGYYKEAFPNTTLFLNIAPKKDSIVEYAARNGINLRYDGLSLKQNKSMDAVSEYFRRYCKNYKFIGVRCLYEFASQESDLKNLKLLFEKGFNDPISYMNINFGKLDSVDIEVKKLIYMAAKKIGYRFVLRNIQCESIMRLPEKGGIVLRLEQVWENVGSAPCYSNYGLRYLLVNESGEIVAEAKGLQNAPVWKWVPGGEIKFITRLSIPPNLKEGLYYLKVGMFDAANSKVSIKLAIEGFDGKENYILFKLRVEKDGLGYALRPLRPE